MHELCIKIIIIIYSINYNMNGTNCKTTSSVENKRLSDKIIGLYFLSGILNTNKIRINHLGNTKLGENTVIRDKEIDFYSIAKLDIGAVHGFVYKCTITHHDISGSKRLPLYFINIAWSRPLQTSSLYHILVYFDITSQINNVDDLFMKDIEGKFSIYAIINHKEIVLEENIIKYPGDDVIIEKLKKLTLMDEMKQHMFGLIDAQKKEMAKLYKHPSINLPEKYRKR